MQTPPESPEKSADRAPADRAFLVEGLGKGLRVIEAFSDEHPRLTVTVAAERAGLSRYAARRHLLSLVHFGYAATDGKHYWLLPKVLRLGQAFMDGSRVPRLVQPFIQRASILCGETLNVATLDGQEVVYLSRSNAPRVVSIGFHPGARVPAHVVATGMAMLSTFEEPALDAWIAAHDFASYTGFTPADPAAFKQSVLLARRLGYWQADQYINFGLCGLGVPLIDRRGRCEYGLSVTVQRLAYPDDQMVSRLLPILQDVAQTLRPII